ncbi:YraN family protein [Arcticibacter sp. MXS-1]|uniref:YraN family protein n=1 Tax=Arcticibacter sp. MXS-1 TaxID=3341726 RepID=UPI0035A8F986
MAEHNQLGQRGEQIAAEFLLNKGYRILHRNWFYGKAEVDIIARSEQFLVFAEVKTRTSTDFGQPEEFVSSSKQRRLQWAAEGYIYHHNYQGEIRFDILSVLFDVKGRYTIRHIEDAFWG